MPVVRFTGWSPGLQRAGLNDAIQTHAGLGSPDADRFVSSLLGGGTPSVLVGTDEDARTLVAKAEELGAIANLIEDALARK
jgi:hypothetical protein